MSNLDEPNDGGGSQGDPAPVEGVDVSVPVVQEDENRIAARG